MRVVLLTVILSIVGCTGDVLPLDPEWRPLRRVVEDDLIPDGMLTTLGSDVHTADVRGFVALDAVPKRACLMHERSHALRQKELGLAAFLAAYLADPRFRWDEEKAAYKISITHLVQNGYGVDVPGLARVLSEKYGGMIEYASAVAWVAAIVTQAGERT